MTGIDKDCPCGAILYHRRIKRMKSNNREYVGKKHCANCGYYMHIDLTDGFVCVNPKSRHIAERRKKEDSCGKWENKDAD